MKAAAVVLALCLLQCWSAPVIRHVVVVVMENRAFDHFVGMKAATNDKIDGCALGTTNVACANRRDPFNTSEPLIFVDDQAVYIQPAGAID